MLKYMDELWIKGLVKNYVQYLLEFGFLILIEIFVAELFSQSVKSNFELYII